LAIALADGSPDHRRSIMVEHVRKAIIGGAEITIELATGAKLHRSIERLRHGNDARLIIGELAAFDTPKANPQRLVLLQDAHRARAFALAKPNRSLDELAARFGRSNERFKRLIRLSYLSPSIVEAIIEASARAPYKLVPPAP
jgi:hypothetical protein